MFSAFALPVYPATVIIGWMKDEQEAILEHMDICAEDLSEAWCPKTFFCCANFMTEFNDMYTKEFFVSFLTEN